MSTETKDGGPAFPFPATNDTYSNAPMGMSLRDWFAGHADIPWNAVLDTLSLKGIVSPTLQQVAEMRARYKLMEADAMLAARTKEAQQ